MTVDLSVPSQGRAHHGRQGTGLRTQAVSEFYTNPVWTGVSVISVLQMRKLRLKATKWVDRLRLQSWEVVRPEAKPKLG